MVNIVMNSLKMKVVSNHGSNSEKETGELQGFSDPDGYHK
jgi:hypothetical protein